MCELTECCVEKGAATTPGGGANDSTTPGTGDGTAPGTDATDTTPGAVDNSSATGGGVEKIPSTIGSSTDQTETGVDPEGSNDMMMTVVGAAFALLAFAAIAIYCLKRSRTKGMQNDVEASRQQPIHI
jgi:hypothetical protein